jgi:hypothetical protein
VDEQGQRVDLPSRQPLEGDYPTSRWQPGQLVRDRFGLSLPDDLPGGPYQIYVNWCEDAGGCLSTPDDAGLLLGDVFVAD